MYVGVVANGMKIRDKGVSAPACSSGAVDRGGGWVVIALVVGLRF